MTHAHSLWIVLVAIELLGSSGFAVSASPGPAPTLTPIYRLELPDGGHRLATEIQIRLEKKTRGQPAFYAVVTNEWLAGLAPLFAIDRTTRFELRRRPPRGQENFTEPLFFALPPENEADAPKLLGRWNCEATREGSKPYVGMELTIEGERVSGRFDQNTDYRFAFITGGTFKSNRLELNIEYIKDTYVMIGHWREGKLRGEWRHIDGSENGTWEGSRPHTSLPPSKNTVGLYQWRRRSDGALSYAIEGERMQSPWEREPRPLCRVWRSR
jgi:hypothetical protein